MADQLLTIYLVRHGESVWNREGHIQGQTDSPLSEVGLRQTHQIRDRFAKVSLTAVYSSPLLRCRAIAELLVSGRGVPLVYLPDLLEGSLGEWEHLSVEAATKCMAEHGITGNPWAVPPGGESVAQVRDRAQRAWHDILAKSQGSVAVVTHGGIIRMVLASILGLAWESPWPGHRFVLENGSVSLVEVIDRSVLEGGAIIRGVNDTCHLKGIWNEP